MKTQSQNSFQKKKKKKPNPKRNIGLKFNSNPLNGVIKLPYLFFSFFDKYKTASSTVTTSPSYVQAASKLVLSLLNVWYASPSKGTVFAEFKNSNNNNNNNNGKLMKSNQTLFFFFFFWRLPPTCIKIPNQD